MNKFKDLDDLRILCPPETDIDKFLADFRDLLIHKNASIDKFLQEFLKLVITHTNSDIGIFSSADGTGTLLQFGTKHVVGTAADVSDIPGGRFFLHIGDETLPKQFRSFAGYVAHTKRPYRSGNVHTDPLYMSIDDKIQSELAVPIILDERLIGVLNVESHQSDFYSDAHELFLCHITELIAEFLARGLDLEVPPLPTLDEINKILNDVFKLSAHASVDEFLQAFLQLVITSTGSDLGFVSLVDSSEKWLEFQAKHVVGRDTEVVGGNPDTWMPGEKLFLPIGDKVQLLEKYRRPSLSGYVAHTKKSYLNGNVNSDDLYLPIDSNVQSELVVPMLIKERLVGVLNVESYRSDFYSSAHELFLRHITELIAESLDALRVRESPEILLMPALQDLNRLLLQNLSTSREFLTEVLHIVITRTGSQIGFVSIADGGDLLLRAENVVGPSVPTPAPLQSRSLILEIGSEELPKEHRSISGHVAHTKRGYRTNNVKNDPLYKEIDPNVRSELAVPILFGEILLGIMNLESYRAGFYTLSHEYFLSAIAQMIASHLYALLIREKFPKPPRQLREGIREALETVTSDDAVTSRTSLNVIAGLIAEALSSRLCTIWLLDMTGTLLCQGTYGVPVLPLDQEQRTSGDTLEWQAIQVAFEFSTTAYDVDQKLGDESLAQKAIRLRETIHYRPHRDLQSSQIEFNRPFLIIPLFAPDKKPLGVIHVGLRKQISDNPVDELYLDEEIYFLESLQGEIAAPLALAAERRQAREAAVRSEFSRAAEIVAREIHDALGRISRGLHRIDKAKQLSKLEKTSHQLHNVLEHSETLVSSGIEDIHRIIVPLWHPIFQSTREFIDEITRLMEELQSYDIVVEPSLPKMEGGLPGNIAWSLCQITHEAVTNIVKHAQARRVEWKLNIEPTQVTLFIKDDGIGFDPVLLKNLLERGEEHRFKNGRSQGLRSIDIRVKEIGGKAEFLPIPGQGVAISVRIPTFPA